MTLFALGLLVGLYPMFLTAAYAAGMAKGAQVMTRTLTAIPQTLERCFKQVKTLLNKGETNHDQNPGTPRHARGGSGQPAAGVAVAQQKSRAGRESKPKAGK